MILQMSRLPEGHSGHSTYRGHNMYVRARPMSKSSNRQICFYSRGRGVQASKTVCIWNNGN